MPTILGIDIGGTSVKLALIRADNALHILKHIAIPTQPADPADIFIHRIAAASHDLIASSPDKVTGIGIGSPGLVDPVAGTTLNPGNLPNIWNCPLRDRLSSLLDLPARIQNDANAAALGEYLFAEAPSCQNLILLTLGTGVGGGIIVHGKLLLGADNAAAELGHLKVEYSAGRLCACGKHGCIEAYAGSGGISAIAASLLKPSRALTPRQIADLAHAGDAEARQTFHLVGQYLGRAIANLIETFNPEKIVIGGGTSASFDLLSPGIESALDELASFPTTRHRAIITPTRFPEDIGVIGAAAVFLHQPS